MFRSRAIESRMRSVSEFMSVEIDCWDVLEGPHGRPYGGAEETHRPPERGARVACRPSRCGEPAHRSTETSAAHAAERTAARPEAVAEERVDDPIPRPKASPRPPTWTREGVMAAGRSPPRPRHKGGERDARRNWMRSRSCRCRREQGSKDGIAGQRNGGTDDRLGGGSHGRVVHRGSGVYGEYAEGVNTLAQRVSPREASMHPRRSRHDRTADDGGRTQAS